MEKVKENAVLDFEKMIRNSWTYARMTYNEQITFINILHTSRTENVLKGTYNQRWEVLQAIYSAYLAGLGYNGPTWRESPEEKENTSLF